MDMKERLQELAENARARIEESEGLDKLNDVRVAYLGKKGELTAILKGMKDVSPEERPKVGQLVNETRAKIESLLEESRQKLEEAVREEKMKAEVIDVTLPAKKARIGHRHPNSIALEEVERIFIGMGYEVVEGPEVEYADYNFTKLNIPENHPARDEQDTFFINDSILLRSQTSPVQARTMEKGKLPIRMIAPGRVFRSDEVDATHSPSFHQIEGLVIDKNITFADLKGTLEVFAKDLRPRRNSDPIISHLQSQVLRLMFPALNVVEKAAVSVKDPAGSKSLAVELFILMYSVCAALILKNTQALHSV